MAIGFDTVDTILLSTGVEKVPDRKDRFWDIFRLARAL